MNFLRRHSSHILLYLGLFALGLGLCAVLVPPEMRAVAQQLIGFPDSDFRAHQVRPVVLAVMCFLPALGGVIYTFGDTLDRYITRQFLAIFGICFIALFTIWLLMDLTDKIGEFKNSQGVLWTIGVFYLGRAPSIILMLLPYSLLLSLLYSLGKLSSNHEIIAMIQSGRGVVRITLPLMVTGILCTLLSMGLNYQWAPIAEGGVDDFFTKNSGKKVNEANKVLYRNAEDRRLWMIGAFPKNYQNGQALLDVEVTTTDAKRQIQSRLRADSALWHRDTRQWTFENPLICRMLPDQPPLFKTLEGPLTIDGWSETPWQLIKPGLSAAYLGVPDLNSWLQANYRHQQFANPSPYFTQWHYRWALPFSCIVTVLLATPLAIHFSRRNTGSGVFLAVSLSGMMLFMGDVILTFGEAGLLRPWLAAWLPNIIFASIGFYFFRRRILGRPIYQSLRQLFS
ncbi:MAG: LptF/LptG family permease [Gloeobacteraceae cyanobacterium ES-bin-144]|nr:LptF/LptG family permease [Verrucomicrobiales bacterium]